LWELNKNVEVNVAETILVWILEKEESLVLDVGFKVDFKVLCCLGIREISSEYLEIGEDTGESVDLL